MKCEVPFRIIVADPLPGVEMKVQIGRGELLGAVESGKTKMVFEFLVRADLGSGPPNFLGPLAQGPKDARFIYVNSGKRAGQHDTCWDRRAKLSLMSISKETVKTVLRSPGARLQTSINGLGRDGGAVCAGVKGLEWRISRSR